MIRRLARLLWRVMPRWLREPMALEAPVVLELYESHYRDVYQSWVRMEVDLGTKPARWNDAGSEPRAFTFDGAAGEALEYPTEAEAFDALTRSLSSDRRYVLLKEKRVFRYDEDPEPEPKLLTGRVG